MFEQKSISILRRLELEHLLGRVAELLEQAGDLALGLVGALVARDVVHHRGRAAHAHEDLALGGRGHELLDDLLGHEAREAGPALGAARDHVVHLELRVHVLQRVQLVAQDDVGLGVVGEDEGDLSLVRGLAHDLLDHLERRRDTGAAHDERGLLVHVGLVRELDDRALERQRVADLELRDVLAQLARGVALDHELQHASLGVGARGRVRTHHDLAVHIGLGQDAAGHRDAHLVLGRGQAEDQALGVVGHGLDLGDLERAELGRVQRLGRAGVGRSGAGGEGGQRQRRHGGGRAGAGGGSGAED